MIDFHCHVLFGIDDGAKTLEESIEILNELKKQNVSKVVATPHFVADFMKADEFLLKREEAFLKIKALICDIEILQGAEVLMVPELFGFDGLEKLCIENTSTLLLEMPFGPWQQWMFDLIDEIKKRGITPVIAHAERYFEQSMFKYRRFFESGEPVYMQFNAESFTKFLQRRSIRRILKENVRPVIGSDAHNLESRCPKMDKAVKIIQSKRFDENFLNELENNAMCLLENKIKNT